MEFMGKVHPKFPNVQSPNKQPFHKKNRLHVQAVSQSSSNQYCRPHGAHLHVDLEYNTP